MGGADTEVYILGRGRGGSVGQVREDVLLVLALGHAGLLHHLLEVADLLEIGILARRRRQTNRSQELDLLGHAPHLLFQLVVLLLELFLAVASLLPRRLGRLVVLVPLDPIPKKETIFPADESQSHESHRSLSLSLTPSVSQPYRKWIPGRRAA